MLTASGRISVNLLRADLLLIQIVFRGFLLLENHDFRRPSSKRLSGGAFRRRNEPSWLQRTHNLVLTALVQIAFAFVDLLLDNARVDHWPGFLKPVLSNHLVVSGHWRLCNVGVFGKVLPVENLELRIL